MGWNGNNKTLENRSDLNSKIPKRGRRSPSLAFLLGLAAIPLIAALVIYFCVSRKGQPPPTPKKAASGGMITEVTPAAVPRSVALTNNAPPSLPLNVKRDHSELTREELLTKVPHWAYSVEDRKRVDPGYEKKHERFLENKEKNPWKTYADNMLAMLLFGDGNIGFMPRFMPTFKDSFLKSLEVPIVVSKDDPPEIQEQKRQLIEAKIWLKDQVDDGKDIVALLNEEYDRQKKIAGLRDTLRREMLQVQRTAKSVQELEDYIEAANVMLRAAGDNKKFKFPTIITELRLQREAAKTQEEGEQ